MFKRFFWSLLFAVLPILGLVPLNHYLVTNVHTFEDASDRNFVALILIETLLIFNISFMIVNTYFNIHPDYKTIAWNHKKTHPDIPDVYYNDENGNNNDSGDNNKKEE